MINKKKLRKFWKWFKIVTLIYIIIGVALFFLQDKFIFHPKKLPANYQYSFNIPFRQIDLPVTANKNLSIVQFTVADSLRKGVVLYFHGNRENINRYAPFAKNFTRNNYEVWMMDYPGFGKSTGKRKEKILYEDALLFYKMAISKIAADSIIIYGKSLGTGIAAFVASKKDCKRLVLETPYYSMDELARHYFFLFPVTPMSKYSLPTYQHFEYIRAPITIFHGTKDRVIPFKQAKRLTRLKTGTELITIPNGKHNNLNTFALYQEKLNLLLQH